jgi:hypothetical protein
MFSLCSYEVKQTKTTISTVATLERPSTDTLMVTDANNIPLAIVPRRNELKDVSFYQRWLTSDGARRTEKAITRLPEFLMQRRNSAACTMSSMPKTTNVVASALLTRARLYCLPLLLLVTSGIWGWGRYGNY